jgi:hypothetical protein
MKITVNGIEVRPVQSWEVGSGKPIELGFDGVCDRCGKAGLVYDGRVCNFLSGHETRVFYCDDCWEEVINAKRR